MILYFLMLVSVPSYNIKCYSMDSTILFLEVCIRNSTEVIILLCMDMTLLHTQKSFNCRKHTSKSHRQCRKVT